MRTFLIYTEKQTLRLDAKNLSRAVAQSGIKEKEEPILAIAEESCVPQSAPEEIPFVLAVMRNANYLPPEDAY